MHSAVDIARGICVDWERATGALGVERDEIWASATNNGKRDGRIKSGEGARGDGCAEGGEVVLTEPTEEVTDEDDEVTLSCLYG